jgi:hypothetical protein
VNAFINKMEEHVPEEKREKEIYIYSAERNSHALMGYT